MYRTSTQEQQLVEEIAFEISALRRRPGDPTMINLYDSSLTDASYVKLMARMGGVEIQVRRSGSGVVVMEAMITGEREKEIVEAAIVTIRAWMSAIREGEL